MFNLLPLKPAQTKQKVLLGSVAWWLRYWWLVPLIFAAGWQFEEWRQRHALPPIAITSQKAPHDLINISALHQSPAFVSALCTVPGALGNAALVSL